MIIEGKVYDVSTFDMQHPGGHFLIHLYAGTDATTAWHSVGHGRASEVVSVPAMYCSGALGTCELLLEQECPLLEAANGAKMLLRDWCVHTQPTICSSTVSTRRARPPPSPTPGMRKAGWPFASSLWRVKTRCW